MPVDPHSPIIRLQDSKLSLYECAVVVGWMSGCDQSQPVGQALADVLASIEREREAHRAGQER